MTADAGVSVYLGNGDGTLRSGGSYPSGSNPGSLAVADFDRDGRLDVAAANAGYWDGTTGSSVDTSLVLLLGNGDGSLRAAQELAAGPRPVSVAAGDFNADNFPDLAAGDGDSGNVSVLLNAADWPVQPPSITIGDVTITEGHTGTRAATFTVTLSAASSQPVTIAFATANGSASAGSDYQPASGTLTFAPGETSKTVTVLVNGDRLGEPNETFFVNLSGATNATIADGQGVGTIADDEPRISIGDVSRSEGRRGRTTLFTFTVTLSSAYDQAVTVSSRPSGLKATRRSIRAWAL